MIDPKGSAAQTPRVVELLNVEATRPRVVRFLGGYTGALLHHTRDGYVPCDGDDDCPTAMHKLKRIWKGWAAVEACDTSSGTWWPTVLVVTEYLEEQLRGRALRGEVWGVSRATRKGNTGKVNGLFLERCSTEQLRQPFDLLPILLRAYRVLSLKLGQNNPLPPRLYMSSSEGPVPKLLDEVRAAAQEPVERVSREEFRAMLLKAGIKLNGEPAGQQNGQKGGAKHE